MIVTLIAGAALALTNQFTYEHIINNQKSAIEKSLSVVITADYFEESDNYFKAYDKDNNFVGMVYMIEAQGYSSIIKALVGISDNKITGVDIVEQLETPGLGANIVESEFKDQFIGKTADQVLLKKDGGEIDGVTGATISSIAITDAIKKVIEQDAITEASPMSKPEETNQTGIIIEDNITEEVNITEWQALENFLTEY